MYKIEVPLAYYDILDVHGDKFLLSSFNKAINHIKNQIPVFQGRKLKMSNLVGGATGFKVDKSKKILTAKLSLTKGAYELLNKNHVARLTGLVLKADTDKGIRTIREFQIIDIMILSSKMDVYKKKNGDTIKRLLKG